MLILTRKVEQGIVIDGVTVVRVLAIEGERVKLGIEAPAAVAVLREELVQEIAGENRAAAIPVTDGAASRLRLIGRQPRPSTEPPAKDS